jgi:hypothetical protein
MLYPTKYKLKKKVATIPVNYWYFIISDFSKLGKYSESYRNSLFILPYTPLAITSTQYHIWIRFASLQCDVSHFEFFVALNRILLTPLWCRNVTCSNMGERASGGSPCFREVRSLKIYRPWREYLNDLRAYLEATVALPRYAQVSASIGSKVLHSTQSNYFHISELTAQVSASIGSEVLHSTQSNYFHISELHAQVSASIGSKVLHSTQSNYFHISELHAQVSASIGSEVYTAHKVTTSI